MRQVLEPAVNTLNHHVKVSRDKATYSKCLRSKNTANIGSTKQLYHSLFTRHHYNKWLRLTDPQPPRTVASTKIFGISVLVNEHDCDKQPSFEYCGGGNQVVLELM